MVEAQAPVIASRRPIFSTRKIVHMSMLIFAFLLPLLTWVQAAGCALLALLFNVLILPRLDVDLRKKALSPGASRVPSTMGTGSERLGETSVWTGIVIYPISVLALVVVYPHDLHVAGAAWAIMALGDGMASVVGESVRGPTIPWNKEKTWAGFLGFVLAGTAGAYVLMRWVAPAIPADKALIACAATALVGAAVETLPIRLDDNVSVPLLCGGFLFCILWVERSALDSNLPYLGHRMQLAIAVNLAFALLALAMKTVSRSGAAVGFVLGVWVYLGYGYKSFLILLAFFVLGSIATRLGYAKKAARGVAERRGGARSWREALANTLAGAFFAILVITTHREKAFLIALVAVFAEAAGDTISSEIGQWLSDRAYLITTFRPVGGGENGGVTIAGTAAGLLASAALAALGYSLGLCGKGGATIALVAASLGNLMDSVLGATLERRGLVSNGIVNFAGTSFAGAVSLAIAFHLGY
jgi:uncharacterized protein (TIGR00297 family)